jgi:hypothetical protein
LAGHGDGDGRGRVNAITEVQTNVLG